MKGWRKAKQGAESYPQVPACGMCQVRRSGKFRRSLSIADVERNNRARRVRLGFRRSGGTGYRSLSLSPTAAVAVDMMCD